jgi:two-component sensor histidine kinase
MLADPANPHDVMEIQRRLNRGETIEHFETTRRRKDGTLVPVALSASPVLNADGRLIGASKIARDITNRRRSEERIRLLTADLKHRTKNLLTVVAALVRRTQGLTVAEYRTALEGRIIALDEANRLLTEVDAEQATLDSLVLRVVRPFRAGGEFNVSGPRSPVGPQSAVALAMALHELATNALKYGALARNGGRVTIIWTQTGDGVRLCWREDGGPATSAPDGGGQGLFVLRSCIEGQFGGRLRLDWANSGLRCEMLIPADRLTR